VVADHQFVSRHMGTERVPSGVSAVHRLRDCRSLPENRCHQSGEGMNRVAACAVLSLGLLASSAQRAPGVGPIVGLDTVKGVIEFETYPEEAPKTVARIVDLVKRGFYNGQRFHRAEPNFVVQIGDPQTRNMTLIDRWGTMGTGKPIGVSEITKKRTHVR